MARPKEFDIDDAINAAVEVFRNHGFEGTSAKMLVDAMGIGRQSLYDTFDDKWGIYCAALRRYCTSESQAHRAALVRGDKAIDGLKALLDRVLSHATSGCLGMGSVVEFGCDRADVVAIRDKAGDDLREVFRATIERAQREGDVGADLAPDEIATFIMAAIWGIRLTARAGASERHVAAVAELTLRAIH